MSQILFTFLGVVFTGWKIIGWMGALSFGARWLVQAFHRQRTGSNELPTIFWYMSLVGAAMTLTYFIFGKNDSVGILQNLLPMAVAIYNIILDVSRRKGIGSSSSTTEINK